MEGNNRICQRGGQREDTPKAPDIIPGSKRPLLIPEIAWHLGERHRQALRGQPKELILAQSAKGDDMFGSHAEFTQLVRPAKSSSTAPTSEMSEGARTRSLFGREIKGT